MTTQPKPNRIEREWVKGLPEVLQGFIWVLEERGEEVGLGEPHKGRSIETPTIHVVESGDSENGPYKLEIMARSTEDGVNDEEPLLRLEIRPQRLWFNEVKTLMGDPGMLRKDRSEPIAVH